MNNVVTGSPERTDPPEGRVSPRARRMPAGRTQAGNAIVTQVPASNALAGHACSDKASADPGVFPRFPETGQITSG